MYTQFALQQLPEKIPTEVMESSPHVCFALTESLHISYCNRVWDRFAAENGGGVDVLAKNVLHKSFLQYVPDEMAPDLRALFETVRALGRPQAHDYECSSAQVFRLYQMQVYPLKAGQGFLIINSLRVAQPHTQIAYVPDETKYLKNDGFVCMCANCHRTRRVDDPAAWDWVPDFLKHPQRRVTHGVCSFCAEYYYGDYVPKANQASRSNKG